MSQFTDQDIVDFVYAESRMLDDWLNLFTEDGRYWMPLTHDQTDARLHTSLMDEDKLLLRIRVERLKGQRTYSQQPHSRCHHLLARPEIETQHAWHQPDQGQYVVRTAFHSARHPDPVRRLDHARIAHRRRRPAHPAQTRRPAQLRIRIG